MIDTEPRAERHYQVDAASTDIPARVAKVMESYRQNRWLAALHVQRFNHRFLPTVGYSLRNVDPQRFNGSDHHAPIFEPTLGSITVENSLDGVGLAEFYSSARINQREDGRVELRGPNYFVAMDNDPNSDRKSPSAKISVIRDDMIDAMIAGDGIERKDIEDENEYFQYLGIIDYLKNHSITLFDALTYPERLGSVDIDELRGDPEYMSAKTGATGLMVGMTRMFYQTCLGISYDGPVDTNGIVDEIERITNYLEQTLKPEESFRFTYPELNDPVTIMLGAQEAALRNPEIDTIVGIPSGGTESAVVIQMAYEVLQQQDPSLLLVPLSLHANFRDRVSLDRLVRMMEYDENNIRGKNILLVDDNSNTGATLQMMSDALSILGAESDKAQIMQHDPRRILSKSSRVHGRAPFLFRIDHTNYQSTMGVVELDPAEHEIFKRKVQHQLNEFHRNQRRQAKQPSRAH